MATLYERLARDIEVMDDDMAEVLRGKTGAQRLKIADEIFLGVREMLITFLQSEHPDWSAQQLKKEAARRISHGAV
jgi:hypothetical protein